MKKSLLATVAAVALIAGHGIASAEGMPKQDAPRQEAPAQRTESPSPAPSTQRNAPAEKMAPAPDQKPGQAQRSPSSSEQRSTTGQGERGTQQQRSEPSRGATQPSTQSGQGTTSQQPNAQQGAQQRSGSQSQTTGSAPSGGGVNLTTEQKTEIRSTVLTSSAPRVTNVNFSINVGTVVPRTVRVVAVPDTIVRIHPAWRGYQYFVYNDEIIIVEPRTLKIVAVLVV